MKLTRSLALLFASILALLMNTTLALATTANLEETRKPDLPIGIQRKFGTPPAVPKGALKTKVQKALDAAFGKDFRSPIWDKKRIKALDILASSKDPRVAWVLSDAMRILHQEALYRMVVEATSKLLKIDINTRNAWGKTTDHLIAWDIPAPPGYLNYKRTIFTTIEPKWNRIFVQGNIDWRHVSWGGVRIDDRPFDTTDTPCNCIPAADNPKVISAEKATWLEDDAVVFGIEVNGEFRAYPRRIMEVREMVNDTLGGRSLGIPYCTLCGAAQAYFTDQLDAGVKRPVLRTSGLLIRSNKVMYDLNTFSVFDTFRGVAVTGPLYAKGVSLKRAGVVTAYWGEWKKAHPNTTVLVESLALGRNFDFRNGRDSKGPIFPIGNTDPRLPVHEDVFGVVTDQGTPIAFHIKSALDELRKGKKVSFDHVHLVLDGGGVRAIDKKGQDLGGHQAFWFAWSQFHSSTKLWPYDKSG